MVETRAVVLGEIVAAGRTLPLARIEALASAIRAAGRVYLHGVGRSGLVVRMFAVRLAHLAIPTSVVGDPTTTAIGPGDLLIAASGSGRTATVLAVAAAAHRFGARVLVLTTDPEAPLTDHADEVVVLPGTAKTDAPGTGGSRQPPGSLFEQMLMLFLEETVLALARPDPGFELVRRRHANLE